MGRLSSGPEPTHRTGPGRSGYFEERRAFPNTMTNATIRTTSTIDSTTMPPVPIAASTISSSPDDPYCRSLTGCVGDDRRIHQSVGDDPIPSVDQARHQSHADERRDEPGLPQRMHADSRREERECAGHGSHGEPSDRIGTGVWGTDDRFVGSRPPGGPRDLPERQTEQRSRQAEENGSHGGYGMNAAGRVRERPPPMIRVSLLMLPRARAPDANAATAATSPPTPPRRSPTVSTTIELSPSAARPNAGVTRPTRVPSRPSRATRAHGQPIRVRIARTSGASHTGNHGDSGPLPGSTGELPRDRLT